MLRSRLGRPARTRTGPRPAPPRPAARATHGTPPGNLATRHLLEGEAGAPPVARPADLAPIAGHLGNRATARLCRAPASPVQRDAAPGARGSRAAQLVDGYIGSGAEWYERGNHAESFSLALRMLVAANDLATVAEVFHLLAANPKVAPAERRGIAAHLANNLPTAKLDELAATDAGRALFRAVKDAVRGGFDQGYGPLIRIDDALARALGHAAADTVLNEAKTRAANAPGLKVLEPVAPHDVDGSLRRIRAMLVLLHRRYDADAEIAPAIARVEADMTARFTTAPGQEIDFDADARQSGATATILARVIEALDRFARMMPPTGSAMQPADAADPLTRHMLRITGAIRADWIAALGRAVAPDGPGLLAVAAARSAALPEALLQLYLGSVPDHGAEFEEIADSVDAMLAWVGWIRRRIARMHEEADRAPANEPAADRRAREVRQARDVRMIELSVEGVKLWDRAIRAHEELQVGIGIVGQWMPHVSRAYRSEGRLRERCARMKDAALADDLDALAALAERNRSDPDIEAFFQGMPLFVTSANVLPALVGRLLISFSILKLASMAGSAAGALVSSGEGASMLNISAQIGLEALVFTGANRTMQAAVGAPVASGFLLDLALNAGLFGVLRFTGAATRQALTARGLEAYGAEATHVTSFAVLQTYGTIHHAIEQGRWPTAAEIADMSVDGLIMYAALAGTHRDRSARPKPHSWLEVLEMLHTRFGERLAGVEVAKQQLAIRIYEQMRVGSDNPAVRRELEAEAAALNKTLDTLVHDITADPLFEAEPLRTALADPHVPSEDTAQKLVAQSLGAPVEAGIAPAGKSQYSYAAGATEMVMEVMEGANAVVSATVDPAGRHLLVAEIPGQPPVFLSERAPAPPDRAPRRIKVPSPPPPAPAPAKGRPRAGPKGEIFAPEGGLTPQGVTQVRQIKGNRTLSVDACNALAVSEPRVHEHLVKEHFRRAINRGEMQGRVVSGHEMTIRGFAEAIPQRAPDAPTLDEPVRDFLNRKENGRLRAELVRRLVRLRGALRIPEAQLTDAQIAHDPWDAAGRLRERAQARRRDGDSLRRAAEEFVGMFARSIGDLRPDFMVVDAAAVEVVDASHTVSTQFEVFHEFKTLLYRRIVEELTGLPVTAREFRSPREQRRL